MISAFFHELKHYKDLKLMSPEELKEHERKYAEDPKYREEFERRVLDFGLEGASKIEEERLRDIGGFLQPR